MTLKEWDRSVAVRMTLTKVRPEPLFTVEDYAAVHCPCVYWTSSVAHRPLLPYDYGQAKCPDCEVVGYAVPTPPEKLPAATTPEVVDDRKCEGCGGPETPDDPMLECIGDFPGPDVHVGCHAGSCRSRQCAIYNNLDGEYER